MGTMRITFTLARYDLRQLVRERGTTYLLVAMALLFGYGLYQGHQFARVASASAQAASVQEKVAREKAFAYAQGFFAAPNTPVHLAERSFRNVADIRGYAFREHVAFAANPDVAGRAFAIGQSDVLPRYVRVRAESMESVRQSNELEHPRRLAVGRLDVMFVAIYLWPLALLALNISALTVDRETKRVNTLRLQGIAEGKILFAQVMARTTAATAFVVGVTLTCAWLFGALPLSIEGVLAGANWALVFATYSVFWAAVSMVISALFAARAPAAFAAFGSWLVLAVLLPQVLFAVVATMYPVPSRERYLLDVREAVDRVNADRIGIAERFYDRHPEWRPQSTALDKVAPPVMRLARASELETRLQASEQRFEEHRRAQALFLERASRLSPVTLTQNAFERLAGNDAARHARFLADVRAFQLSLRQFFQARLQQSALAEERQPCAHPSTTCMTGFGFTAHKEVPVFTPSAALSTAPKVRFGECVVLLLWGAALAVLAGLTLGRSQSRH
jgi:ABC-2 type transport system permease protein